MLEWWSFADWASPLLPGTTGLWWARRLSWAMVLGALLLMLWPMGSSTLSASWSPVSHHAQRRRSLQQAVAVGMLCVLCLLPGVWSPAYWLGLAFQMPSLMSVAWALHVMHGRFDGPARTRWAPLRGRQTWLNSAEALAFLGVMLGWVLLLDVLAVWPVQLYTSGFDGRTTLVLTALALLTWVCWGQRLHESWRWVLVVLLVFELSRWPNGNVWAALLDPLLWVGLQIWCVWRLLRLIRARGR